MTALVDIGNTNIVVAFEEDGVFVGTFRVKTDTGKTSDEYYVVFSSLVDGILKDRNKVDKVIVSSVVPFLTRTIEKNMKRLFSVSPLLVSLSSETGLVKDSIPVELGSDLLANMAYAHSRCKDRPAMVIDFGTALTFSTVSGDGRVLGVAIAPGLVTAVNSLFGATAQLPQVELKVPSTVLGRNSVDSIRGGIMQGYAGLVEGMIKKTEEELGEELYVFATGGLSNTISPLLNRIDELDSFLTLKGLKVIGDLN